MDAKIREWVTVGRSGRLEARLRPYVGLYVANSSDRLFMGQKVHQDSQS